MSDFSQYTFSTNRKYKKKTPEFREYALSTVAERSETLLRGELETWGQQKKKQKAENPSTVWVPWSGHNFKKSKVWGPRFGHDLAKVRFKYGLSTV